VVEAQSMTVADVVAQVRDGRLEDFVREAVALVAREIMESEVAAQVGAERGEVAPEARVTHRNGYRPRPWETRVGEIELLIPRTRQGSYFPSFLEPRRRSEPAIVAVVLEAYVNGVSTRKVDRLVEQLGIEGMTPRTGSRRCAARWMSRSSCFAGGRWRAPTRICGETPSTSRSATTGAWCPRHWWWPMPCMRPGCGR
jgi:putative transposase